MSFSERFGRRGNVEQVSGSPEQKLKNPEEVYEEMRKLNRRYNFFYGALGISGGIGLYISALAGLVESNLDWTASGIGVYGATELIGWGVEKRHKTIFSRKEKEIHQLYSGKKGM